MIFKEYRASRLHESFPVRKKKYVSLYESMTKGELKDIVRQSNEDLSTIEIDGIPDMSYLFKGADIDDSQDISGWDVSDVQNMKGMFQGSNFNGDINGWDVSGVHDMSYMFYNNDAFNKPLNKWTPWNVTTMKAMFQDADAFNQSLNAWGDPYQGYDKIASVQDMSFMFAGTSKFNQPLDKWDVSGVKNMEGMFQNAKAFNQDLSGWNVSNVQNFDSMFEGASKFDCSLGDWRISKVINPMAFDDFVKDAHAFLSNNTFDDLPMYYNRRANKYYVKEVRKDENGKDIMKADGETPDIRRVAKTKPVWMHIPVPFPVPIGNQNKIENKIDKRMYDKDGHQVEFNTRSNKLSIVKA